MSTIFSRNVLLITIGITVFYVLFVLYLMNTRLITQTIVGSYSLSYKSTLLFSLLGGMWTAMTHTALAVLVTTALLTGLNVALLAKKVRSLGGLRNTHLIIGGSLLGIVGSGCAACGLPVLSLLGLSSSAMYLPLHGSEFSYLALFSLIFSAYMLIKQNKRSNLSCPISERKKVDSFLFFVKNSNLD